MTNPFHLNQRVRQTHDHGTAAAVPAGTEGVIVEVSGEGRDVVVDFGEPWCERGCRCGAFLEVVDGR